MKIRGFAALAAVCISAVSGVVRAERCIVVDPKADNAAGTFYIGKNQVGDPTIEVVFTGTKDGTEGSRLTVRNDMVPVEGSAEGKRGYCWSVLNANYNGPGIRVPDTDDVQFWASADGEAWELIPVEWGAVTFTAGPSTIAFTDHGSNGWPTVSVGGTIPAVSSWGLLALALLAACSGTAVLRRKRELA